MDRAVRHPIQDMEHDIIAIISSTITGYSTFTPMKWRYTNSLYKRNPLAPKSTSDDICGQQQQTKWKPVGKPTKLKSDRVNVELQGVSSFLRHTSAIFTTF